MWESPSLRLLKIYNVFTILFAVPCVGFFLIMISADLRSTSYLTNDGIVLGSCWLSIPLMALFMVALANLPSTGTRCRLWLSTAALMGVLFLAAMPLTLMVVL